MNRVEISGGLTRDPEIRFLPSGMAVTEFTVAVSGTRYDGQQRQQVVTTSYIACTLWGARGEEFVSEVRKGDEVLVLGELRQDSYEKKDGSKESKTRVTCLVWHVLRQRGVRTGPPQEEEPEPTSLGEEPF